MSEIKKETSSETICRLCFQERDHFQSIFCNENTVLGEWIENLTLIKISYIPNAPAALCLECETVLKNFELFREMCFTNNVTFRQMFPQTEQPIEAKDTVQADREAFHFEYIIKDEIDLEQCDNRSIKHLPEHNTTSELDLENGTDVPRAKEQHLPYQCDICLRRFGVERSLRRHTRVHLPRKPKLRCEHCEITLINDKALQIHMRTHTQEELYGCLECGQSFSTSGLLTRHVRSHNYLV